MKLAEELEALKRRKASEFDLLEFAVALGDVELSRFEPTMRWHYHPVTEKQCEFISHCGIDLRGITTKGHAAFVIDRLMKRRAVGLATFKQVRALRRFGVKDAHLFSFAQASIRLDRLFITRKWAV